MRKPPWKAENARIRAEITARKKQVIRLDAQAITIRTVEPITLEAPMVSFKEWESVYIKWDDDRGRGFDNVTRFHADEDWIELTYTHPDAGEVEIKIRNHGIRWIEFFETKVEDDQE